MARQLRPVPSIKSPVMATGVSRFSRVSTTQLALPDVVQFIMLAAPTTHYVAMSQAILFRGAGASIVWPHLLALVLIAGGLFALSLGRFRTALWSG